MMTSECSGRAENIKFLVVLPLIVALLLCVLSCRDKSDSQKNVKGEVIPTSPPPSNQSAQPLLPASFYVFNGDTAWVEVDEMPKFPGGEAALIKYIFDFIIYPFDATAEGVQGKVIAGFMVREDGTVSNVKIIEGANPDLNTEAIRVIKMLPKFEKPAIKDGKPINVWYMIPINYTLK